MTDAASVIFVDVAGLSPGGLRPVESGQHKILVCNADGEFFAIENRCPHIHIPLDTGRLRGCVLECPLHGGRLDVRDGSDIALPIREPAKTYLVRQVAGGIEIDLSQEVKACTT